METKLIKIFSLNDIAKVISRDKTTIIKWEKQGRIPKAKRDQNGWRFYSEKEANKIIKLAEKIADLNLRHHRKVAKSKQKIKIKGEKNTDLNFNKILKTISSDRVLKHILSTPKLKQKLINRIIKDDKLQKQIIMLLIKSISRAR
ncbi:MAG: hypothetical protein ABIG60_02275 [Patescibacteria group bacterium]